jgi:hypothetical protein
MFRLLLWLLLGGPLLVLLLLLTGSRLLLLLLLLLGRRLLLPLLLLGSPWLLLLPLLGSAWLLLLLLQLACSPWLLLLGCRPLLWLLWVALACSCRCSCCWAAAVADRQTPSWAPSLSEQGRHHQRHPFGAQHTTKGTQGKLHAGRAPSAAPLTAGPKPPKQHPRGMALRRKIE